MAFISSSDIENERFAIMVEISLSKIAVILTVLGAGLMLAYCAVVLVGYSIGSYFYQWDVSLGGWLALICGLIAIMGVRKIDTIPWSIVLIIVGIIGGHGGGFLVVIGGVIGLMLNTYPKGD
ncbi:MAG TPA: hypothetical protein VGK23_01660 [Methanomassiliicoccales archaeon]